MKILKSLLQKLGLDKAIAYSSGARVIQGITGVGSVFFISTFLSGVEQGFYYTFGSILALQVFFELGLTGIMTQYVAHEVSHLKLSENGEYYGEDKYKSRLASLVRFCVKWYSVLAILVFIFLILVGFIYFNKYGDSQSSDVVWTYPWIIICITTSIQLFISPLTAILAGLGFVNNTSEISFFQQLIVPIFTWVGLSLGFKLYICGVSYFISMIIWFFFVVKKGLAKILFNLWKSNITERVKYMEEIFPYQWKIALSWISGYFIFQLFNPVLFATEGAVVAGQMGMTLQALNAINAFAMCWINTKVPMMSGLIANKHYDELDSVFNRTVKQMSIICAFLLISFFIVILILRVTHLSLGDTVFADRFLDYLPMILMIVPVFSGQFVNAWATYLRCHKDEPFLVYSIVAGLLCLVSTFVLGHAFGLYGITIGYCTIRVLMCPWAYKIFQRKRTEWHNS